MKIFFFLLLFCVSSFAATRHTVKVECNGNVSTNVAYCSIPAKQSVTLNLKDWDYKIDKGLHMVVTANFGTNSISFGPFTAAPNGFFVKVGDSSLIPSGTTAPFDIKPYLIPVMAWGTSEPVGFKFTFVNDTGMEQYKEGGPFLFFSCTDYDGTGTHSINIYNETMLLNNYWSKDIVDFIPPIAKGASVSYYIVDTSFVADKTKGIKLSFNVNGSDKQYSFGGFEYYPSAVLSSTPSSGPLQISSKETSIVISNPTAAPVSDISINVNASDSN